MGREFGKSKVAALFGDLGRPFSGGDRELGAPFILGAALRAKIWGLACWKRLGVRIH